MSVQAARVPSPQPPILLREIVGSVAVRTYGRAGDETESPPLRRPGALDDQRGDANRGARAAADSLSGAALRSAASSSSSAASAGLP